MYAIKAVYDGAIFKPMQPIPVKEDYEVVITFIKPTKKDMAHTDEQRKLPRSTIIGLLEGQVWMSNDFNDPIEEMREYME